jgi:hypothetical protein
MSINNFTDAVGFSINGLQNIALDTINGNPILSTITIAGQTSYLSYDSTTSTLTIIISTSSALITGLLTSTDWAKFNNKEEPLTFSTPLARGGIGGNTISFDFSTANNFTGVNTFSNLVNFNSNIKLNALPYAITPTALYIDGTGLLSYGASPDLLPLDNIWTGSVNFFNNSVIIKNIQAGTYSLIVYRNNPTFPDFLYLNNAGKMGYYDGADKWSIDNQGQFVGSSIIVENRTNTIDPMKIHRDILSFPNEYLYFNNTGSLGFNPGAWSINRFGQFNGSSIIVNDFIQATNNIQTTNGFLGGLGLDIQSILNAIANFLNIYGETYLNNNGLYFRNQGDKNHGIIYNNSYDCPRIFGYGAGAEFGRHQGSYTKCAVIGTSTRPMEIFRDFVNAPSDSWEFLNNGDFRYLPPSGGGWQLNASGMIIPNGTITVVNASQRNQLSFTEFGVTPSLNQWISTTHSLNSTDSGKRGDKVVIGNIYDVNPSYGATIGSHNSALNGWRDLYVNLGGYTIMPSLIVTVNFSPPSDRRLKDEIRYLDSGKSIDFIKRLKPCIYKRVDKRNIPDFKEPEAKLQHGFIADEIEAIAQTEAQKNLVDTFEFNGYKDCRKLSILNLIPEIVQANKEMIDKIERLETENRLLLERLEAIEKLLKK